MYPPRRRGRNKVTHLCYLRKGSLIKVPSKDTQKDKLLKYIRHALIYSVSVAKPMET